jgi:Concanavalin A-like lectin/glucanases superfamily/Secretion system C-terminal sorting domain
MVHKNGLMIKLSDKMCRTLALLVFGLVALTPKSVEGQALRAHAPERVKAGGEAVLYLDWTDRESFEGGVFRLPAGWDLLDAWVTRPDAQRVAFGIRPLIAGNGFQLTPITPVSGAATVILRVLSPEILGSGTWSFTPYRVDRPDPVSMILEPDLGRQVDGRIASAEAAPSGNLSLSTGEGHALGLDGRMLPDLSMDAAFTVESWVRVAQTEQVIMSVWDGQEETPYSMDLVIDHAGHVVFYQGTSGDHRAMRSQQPVADGAWHHVAITHDPERAWGHLIVDGAAQDSLTYATRLASRRPGSLVLGGRAGPNGPVSSFEGELDEVRIWTLARTTEMVGSTMYRELPQPAAGAVFLSFDRPLPPQLLLAGASVPHAVPSDLTFRAHQIDLEVGMDDLGVTLSWTMRSQSELDLAVERSDDGTDYQSIGRLSSEGAMHSIDGSLAFSFRDNVRETVAFYRVRQVRKSGADLVSSAVKVGHKEQAEQPRLAILNGSFPNPFNPSTTISYSLVEGQEVSVSVWDLAGQLVRTLWGGFQETGDYTVSFSAGNLPSGTYFVRMESPEGIQSHPILLMK